MSLINDALKRARLEALRQEETERRTYRAVPAHSLRSARRGLLLVGGWIAAAVAAAVAAWIWLAAGSETGRAVEPAWREPAASSVAAPSSPLSQAGTEGASPREPDEQLAAAPTQPPPPGAESRAGAEAIAADAPQQGSTGRAAGAGVPPQQAAGASKSESPGTAAPPEAARVESRGSSATAKRPRLESGETYLRSVTSADGSVAELGGIAYSTSRPIAVINGSVVSNGDLIAGFTVVAIEPERVELEADGVRIFLALH